jgi:hypothetical protein
MAFTFVVETGTADPDANSYVDLDYANDYLDVNSYISTTWDALTDDQKERLLVRASKMLDTLVAWSGMRVDDDSGLRWPRSGVYDADGFLIPDDVIPEILKDATCELAGYLMSSDWSQPSGTRGLKEIEVDVIRLDFDSNIARPSLPPFIIQMLAALGTVAQGSRPAFKPIIRT